ncbi:dTDP-4-dehydrorhamnose reductase [Ponticaulis sp.]|uniref:dTDP-4-dehydrorhamnose reductase n=1 Tax=Ponticaulis sp. TaxID=2020902 RepID=UPI0026065603|nr:dTDP-4-dehydrorhamnose reductase [Ponticaulis sp.]MDF1682195.1 dTDP-4-dehydrorhamnose reductase [Ponticaulis sp.]
MTVLVFGANGQVGRELQRVGYVRALSREEADVSKEADIVSAIEVMKPTAIVNAAAYTAVDKAETETEAAHLVNAVAPGIMAREARSREIPFVHISTDFVFDGTKTGPYTEDDVPSPKSVYGQTKLDGEKAVLEVGGNSVVLRTAWVFSPNGSNFVHIMMRLADERGILRVVEDQFGGPTSARDIAVAALNIVRTRGATPGESAIYHYAGGPDVSRVEFARQIFRLSGRAPEILPIPTTDYPTPAERPLNSRLDCSEIEKDFGIERPDWRESLARVLEEMGELKANG